MALTRQVAPFCNLPFLFVSTLLFLQLLAQFIFMGVQWLTSFFVSEIYRMASLHPFISFFFLCTMRGRNISVNGFFLCLFLSVSQSHFILVETGLFNDPFEMLFVYLAIYLLLKKRMTWSLLAFSAAVSVKMSALLYAPGALLVFLSQIGLKKTIVSAIPAVALQIVVGLPFLLTFPWPYLSRSYEFSRTFHWFLSHNWKFLPEEIFNSRIFHACLLALHLSFLAMFAYRKGWFRLNLNEPGEAVYCMFVGNLVGMAFSRSLHYSFYLWYMYTLPFMLVHRAGKLEYWHSLFLLVIEICWNQWTKYDPLNIPKSCASWKASLVLTCCHMLFLAYLLTEQQVRKSLLPTSQKQF